MTSLKRYTLNLVLIKRLKKRLLWTGSRQKWTHWHRHRLCGKWLNMNKQWKVIMPKYGWSLCWRWHKASVFFLVTSHRVFSWCVISWFDLSWNVNLRELMALRDQQRTWILYMYSNRWSYRPSKRQITLQRIWLVMSTVNHKFKCSDLLFHLTRPWQSTNWNSWHGSLF